MRFLSLTFFLLLSFSSFAQTSTTEVGTTKNELSDYNWYIGGNVGAAFGEVAVGYSVGYILNSKNVLELSTKRWRNEPVGNAPATGAARITNDGNVISLANKYFLYNSFHLKGGLFYRDATLNVPAGVQLGSNNSIINERDMTDLGIHAAIGNHWFGKRWSFSVEWIGYSTKIIKINEVSAIDFSNLQLLNLTLAYSF